MSSQGAGNAIDSLQAPMAPTANIPMAEEATTRTALQQQAINKARNAEYAGMSGVQGVDVKSPDCVGASQERQESKRSSSREVRSISRQR